MEFVLTIANKKKDRYNPVNERMKYKYRIHLRRVSQRDEKTIISYLKHIRAYEMFTGFSGFETFSDNVADQYVRHMFDQGLSLSHISDNIRAVKEFLRWLERQRGYRSKIDYNHIDYLNISNNQRKTAKATEYKEAYTYDQIIATIRQMPDKTDIEKRNRAIISLQALCTLRISELRTVKIKNVIEEDGWYFIYVCPKHMDVKTAKTRHAVFVPLPPDLQQNVIGWRDHLLSIGFKPSDPLFPVINNRFGQNNLLEQTIKADGIKSNTTIRNVFKKAFEEAGFKYIRPHSFRHTLARYAETQSPAFMNAVRQNLGHESIDTTLNSYGQLSMAEQRRIISGAIFKDNA